MADFTQYQTVGDERWDNVAWKCYGDASRYPEIAAANRELPLTDVIPAGTVLQIPIVEPVTVDANLLPPWKR